MPRTWRFWFTTIIPKSIIGSTITITFSWNIYRWKFTTIITLSRMRFISTNRIINTTTFSKFTTKSIKKFWRKYIASSTRKSVTFWKSLSKITFLFIKKTYISEIISFSQFWTKLFQKFPFKASLKFSITLTFKWSNTLNELTSKWVSNTTSFRIFISAIPIRALF